MRTGLVEMVLISTAEAARRLGVSQATLRRYLRERRLPGVNLAEEGARPIWRVDEEVLTNWIRARGRSGEEK